MKRARIGLIILFVWGAWQLTLGQDIHFSQYFANPISFNPANTGFYDGSYRLGVNHKQQWPWAIDGKFLNYNSTAASVDFSVLDKQINNFDWAGIGFNFINDNAGDGNLKAQKAYVSLAYHKGLDKFHKHFVSIGTTLGFVQRRINFAALYFNNQWQDRVGFDLSLPNNEQLFTEQSSYFDLGVGIQGQNQLHDKVSASWGVSLLHLNRPKETFYDQNNRLGIRYLSHLSVDYQFHQKWNMNLGGYLSVQKKAKEIMVGSMFSYIASNPSNDKVSKIMWGTYYRVLDAVSPMFGYQYHNTRLIVNYDVNLSSLTKVSRANGGFEISLTHVGTFANKKDFTKKVYCPSF